MAASSSSITRPCTRCHKPAIRICDNCVGAPRYLEPPEVILGAVYCGKKCQKADWQRHKSECKLLQNRKTLYRAALILQDTFCLIRKNAYPFDVASVGVDETSDRVTVAVRESKRDDAGHFWPFIFQLGDERRMRGVLLYSGSSEAMVYLSELVNELLDGLIENIVEVETTLRDEDSQVCIIREGSGTSLDTLEAVRHAYKITLANSNSETWAIDITNPPDKLIRPWPTLLREQGTRPQQVGKLGSLRQQLELSRNPSPAMKAKIGLARHLEGGIPNRGASKRENFNAMLKWSEEAFQSAKQQFLDDVEAHVGTYSGIVTSRNHEKSIPEAKTPRLEEPITQKGTDWWNSLTRLLGLRPRGPADSTAASNVTEDLAIDPEPPQATPDATPNQEVKWYSIAPIPGKGLGMVAARFIPKGTRILSEAAILTMSATFSDFDTAGKFVDAKFQALPAEQKAQFLALHNCQPTDYGLALAISRTNGLPFGDHEHGVFLETARINHSCRPNSHHAWNASLKQLTVHAVEDIEQGHEITITYMGNTPTFPMRQSHLKELFGFTCACNLCSVSNAKRKASDRRLDRMLDLDNENEERVRWGRQPLAALWALREQLLLAEKEELGIITLARLYRDVVDILLANADAARVVVFAEKERALRLVMEGEDGTRTVELKALMECPGRDDRFGYRSWKWLSDEREIPRELGEEAFGCWLWREA
ncbi:hypothetical protein QBC34DRAFT_440895 [Podospora aff. communis PSN243]|uniref:SET domain-containing protein n=1 Tax=Podospora aff. communis PSN243 TaxID=3040156 RepID=A0AAV9GE41_9PEZI|nr:hypothetical protein QBC34DRAFT_440895 [Podospora aff. communis PSN243]